MSTMTKDREGFHVLFAQVPAIIWDRLEEESARRGESMAKTLTRILQKNYRIPDESLPKPKRAGRPRKRGAK